MGFAGFSAIDTKTVLGDLLGEGSAHVSEGIWKRR
jgi:hypothetical protein